MQEHLTHPQPQPNTYLLATAGSKIRAILPLLVDTLAPGLYGRACVPVVVSQGGLCIGPVRVVLIPYTPSSLTLKAFLQPPPRMNRQKPQPSLASSSSSSSSSSTGVATFSSGTAAAAGCSSPVPGAAASIGVATSCTSLVSEMKCAHGAYEHLRWRNARLRNACRCFHQLTCHCDPRRCEKHGD